MTDKEVSALRQSLSTGRIFYCPNFATYIEVVLISQNRDDLKYLIHLKQTGSMYADKVNYTDFAILKRFGVDIN